MLHPSAASIFLREVNAYEKADVVMTITEDDTEKIMMTIDEEFDLLTRLAHNLIVRLILVIHFHNNISYSYHHLIIIG